MTVITIRVIFWKNIQEQTPGNCQSLWEFTTSQRFMTEVTNSNVISQGVFHSCAASNLSTLSKRATNKANIIVLPSLSGPGEYESPVASTAPMTHYLPLSGLTLVSSQCGREARPAGFLDMPVPLCPKSLRQDRHNSFLTIAPGVETSRLQRFQKSAGLFLNSPTRRDGLPVVT